MKIPLRFRLLYGGLAFFASCAIPRFSETARADDVSTETIRLANDFQRATALLYGQEADGTYKMVCTATAFEKGNGLVRFVTAAHCVATDNEIHERVKMEVSTWYITFDDEDRKDFLPARVLGVGYQHRGDDFAVVEVKTDKAIPTIPLASKPATTGEPVINVASPYGLGKQLFHGYVSMARLSRPVIARDINWKNAMLLQINVGGGSSGSAVVSVLQKGIVAFLVGAYNGGDIPAAVAIPAERFSHFWADIRAGKYKWYKPEPSDEPTSGVNKK